MDLSSTDSQAAGLPASYTFTAADAGSHTFTNVVLETAGSQTITATDSVTSTITGSATVNVVPATVQGFAVTTSFANPDLAGTVGTVTVTAMDHYGNVVGSGPNQYVGTVYLSSTDAQAASLPASYTFTAGDGGSHTFTHVVLKTAGNRVITATDSLTSTITGRTTLLVTGATSTAAASISATFSTASQTVPLTATVTSAAGTVDEGTETFSILSGTTVIGSAVTVDVANGTASASYALPGATSAGTYTIQAVYNGTADFLGSTDTRHSLTVSVPPTPTIIGEQSQTISHKNKKGKPVGKPVLVGFTLDFSTTMYPPSVVSIPNYQVDSMTTRCTKKSTVTVLKPVGFKPAYNPSNNSVTLTLQGKQTFATGGQIAVINSPPAGVSSATVYYWRVPPSSPSRRTRGRSCLVDLTGLPHLSFNFCSRGGDRVIGVGATLNERFTLDKELGQGGMGTVYRATDQLLGRNVAIKLLKDSGTEKEAEQIRLEAQILARLVHDKIVRLYDFGESEGTYFLVMEEVNGPSFCESLAKPAPGRSAADLRTGGGGARLRTSRG